MNYKKIYFTAVDMLDILVEYIIDDILMNVGVESTLA